MIKPATGWRNGRGERRRDAGVPELRIECAACGEWSPFTGRVRRVPEGEPFAGYRLGIYHCPSCGVDFAAWNRDHAPVIEAWLGE